MSQVHVYRLRVKFGDCDPAGIVYYPKFFDWFHQAMESWFDNVLGAPYASVIWDRKIGFPAAHTQADFKHLWVYIDRVSAPEANATGGE